MSPLPPDPLPPEGGVSRIPLGYSRIAIDAITVVGLTPPATATYVELQGEGADFRFRDDGVDPTTAVGAILFRAGGGGAGGNNVKEYNGDLSAMKIIASAGSGFVHASFYR